MASILTNTNAMAALSTLRSIASDLSTTQDRISSGLKVGSASDNAAYWSIATTMRSDNKALGAVSDALGMGAAKVDTASAGMDAAIKVVTDIKAKVVAAKEQGVDKAKVQEEVTQLLDQLKSIGTSASFNGENWLVSSANATKTVVSGFVRDASGNVSVKTTDYALDANSMLYTEATPDGTFADAALELGHLYLNQRKLADSVDYFERVVSAYQACRNAARTENKVSHCNDESYAESSFYIGLIRWQQGNYEQALAVLRPRRTAIRGVPGSADGAENEVSTVGASTGMPSVSTIATTSRRPPPGAGVNRMLPRPSRATPMGRETEPDRSTNCTC